MRFWIRGPEIRILTLSPGAFFFLSCFFPRLGICFLVCEFRTVAQALLRGKTHSLQVVFRAFTYPQPGMGTVVASVQCGRFRHCGKSKLLLRKRQSFPQGWL